MENRPGFNACVSCAKLLPKISVLNDAWSQNWSFVPFTNEEFEHLGKDLKMLADEELVKIAEVDGNPSTKINLQPWFWPPTAVPMIQLPKQPESRANP